MAGSYARPRRGRRFFLLAALAAVLVGAPAWCQRIRIEPVPPGVTPRWTRVPNAPGVSYAPNIPTDVFRYRGGYYFYWEGYLYKAREVRGPYTRVKRVPAFFYQIDPAYFKTYRPQGTAPGSLPPGPPGGPPGAAPTPAPETPAPPAAELPKVM
jgi:hypothetical protein